jgi:hypothetical protein
MADKIQCDVHGEGWDTYVCHHLKGDAFGLGFHREEPTPESLYPDAFCDECEKIYEEQGEWNDITKERIKISLLCSSCYERARIRNTRTAFTLKDLEGLRWKCGSCEKWHSGPCLDFGYDSPIYWTEDHAKLRARSITWSKILGKEPRTFLDDDYCAIEGEHFFVRGLIQLPILGSDKHFCWGVWGSLKRENFGKLRERDAETNPIGLPPMFSWLSNSIPEYSETLNLKMYAHVRGPGLRPLFELESADHPLTREYHDGISPERVREIMFRRIAEFEGRS